VAIFGDESKRETGPNSWNSIVRENRIRNPPLDGAGRKMALRNFQQMQPIELERWRDHIVDSFTEGSGCDEPLQFVRTTGDIPVLTVYRMGKTEEVLPKKEKGKGRARKAKSNDNVGKGRKSKAIVEESTDEGDDVHMEPDSAKPLVPRPRPKPRLAEDSGKPSNQSHTLQSPSMTNGTLPVAWRQSGYFPAQVSVLLKHAWLMLWCLIITVRVTYTIVCVKSTIGY
jgi:hypothetical protein